MKRILILLFVFALLVSFSGCTDNTNNALTNTEVTANNNNNNNNQKESVGETIQQILGKAKNVDNIEYTMAMSMNGTLLPMTTKVYQKASKYKSETTFMGATQSTIFDGENLYMYVAEEDIYYLYDDVSSDSAGGADFSGVADQALADPELKELGKEKVNGLNTRKIEFTYDDQKVVVWVSEDYGILVKMEVEVEGQGTTSIELTDIKVNSVDDAVFVVPQDKVQPMENMYSLPE